VKALSSNPSTANKQTKPKHNPGMVAHSSGPNYLEVEVGGSESKVDQAKSQTQSEKQTKSKTTGA
jgi:hypothetical protein